MQETKVFLNNILKENDTIVIGLSGGPDSMCLLHILNSLNIKLKIICAHINHNIRKESYYEAEYLEKYCHENNYIFETTLFPKKNKDKNYTEAELRERRYKYFEEIIAKYNAKYLLTAHHGDDLIETILMRITRGSDLKGYSGFQVINDKKNYKILKPLVFTTKEEILEYNKINNIPSFTDKTNQEDKYTRNRYRNNVLPFLKEENKDVHLKYLKFSKELQKYYEYVDMLVEKELDKRFKNKTLDITNIKELDDLILENLIKKILDKNYIDNLYLVSDKHVSMIIDLINNNKPNIDINLPDNLKVRKSYNKLTITRDKNNNKDYYILCDKDIILPNNHRIEFKDSCDSTSNYCIRLNSNELTLPLYIRTRKDGDKMIIKNMNGYKKIKDIFIDLKLSTSDRGTQPILVDSEDNILWIPGLKKSKFDKAKTDTYDIILWYN